MYRDYMDIRLVKSESGESETTLVVNDAVVNWRRVLHGGAMCALLDSAGSSAIRSALPPGYRAVTATITVEFLRPVPEGAVLIAYGHTVHVGKGLASGRAEAMLNGELVATATGLWRVLEGTDVQYRRKPVQLVPLMESWQRVDLSRVRELPPANLFPRTGGREASDRLSEDNS